MATGYSQPATKSIHLNQIGFYPHGPKIAVIVSEEKYSKFIVKVPNTTAPVYSGTLQEQQPAEFSKAMTQIADFSPFTGSGTFILEVPGLGTSHTFEIKPNVYEQLHDASLKSYYFQRASIALEEKYAERWRRPAGHPDEKVIIHGSAASKQRPAGTIISSSKGWYDAGDYNKYIVNSGITMGTLLSAYEEFGDYFYTRNLNIPESNNTIPDILDEILWNLEWMRTMQDPNDGGVYHKLTNPNFDALAAMPHEARGDRYVVRKSTSAALNFAAVMAQAGRILIKFDQQKPGLGDSCIRSAIKAWEWAMKNPTIYYKQNEINKEFEPDIVTGEYGDGDVSDEFFWAAAELHITTKDNRYFNYWKKSSEHKLVVPSWNRVRALGNYSLYRHERDLLPEAKKELGDVKAQILKLADELQKSVPYRSFRTVMGASIHDFIWGSNAVAANQAIALVYAYKITNNKNYLNVALSNLDYLLGRNATGYSFVTGFGSKSPNAPHHRPSVAYKVGAPVPGLLVGGPNHNAAKQDNCKGYQSAYPDQVYIDDECSYASNEVAINWNAPLVYLTAAMEALQYDAGWNW